MNRVYAAMQRAAEEQQNARDGIESPRFDAIDRLFPNGAGSQTGNGDLGLEERLMGPKSDGEVSHVAAAPAPTWSGRESLGTTSGTRPGSADPVGQWLAPANRPGGKSRSFEELIGDIARDEQRMNL